MLADREGATCVIAHICPRGLAGSHAVIVTVHVMMFKDGVNRLFPMLIGVAEAVHRHNRCQPAQKQKTGYQPQASESPRGHHCSNYLTLSNEYIEWQVLGYHRCYHEAAKGPSADTSANDAQCE